MKVMRKSDYETYYIDEEKRTVVCVLELDRVSLLTRIQKYNIPLYSFRTPAGKVIFKGIAKCAPEDKFDVIKGKDLAFNRAIRKHNKYCNRFFENHIQDMERRLNNMKQYGMYSVPEVLKL